MTTNIWTYSKLLAEQLRVNGVNEAEVREVVAQVQHHAASTGEDPVDAFGQPVDYANAWRAPRPARWAMRSLAGVAGVTGLLALVNGLPARVPLSGHVDLEGHSVFTWVVWGLGLGLLPWTFDLWLRRRTAGRVGESPTVPDWVIRTGLASLIVVGAWIAFGLSSDDGLANVIFSVPRWLLLLVGVTCLPGVFFMGVSRRDQMPLAPGSKESWAMKVRRAFYNP